MFGKEKPKWFGEESYKGKDVTQCDIEFELVGTLHTYHCGLIKGHEGKHMQRPDEILVDFVKLLDKWDINRFHNTCKENY